MYIFKTHKQLSSPIPRTPVNTCHRLSIRIDPKQKSMLIQAASLQSNGLTDFDTRTSIIAPQAVIEQHERLELSEKADPLDARSSQSAASAEGKTHGGNRCFAFAFMSIPLWREESIADQHNRMAFDC
jgi:uncharacterized protein (DUF1778 family)